MTHYDGITFEERCSLALVTLHETMGYEDESEWTITSAGKVSPPARQLLPATPCRRHHLTR